MAPFPGLNYQVPLVDKAPRWIVFSSIVVVIALLAGAGYVVVKGGRHYPGSWDPRVAPIAAWVAKNRKIDFKHPVEVKFLTPAEYTKASTGGDDQKKADTAADKKEMDDSLAQLRALGLIEGKVDLGKASNTLSDSGSLAFYSPDDKKVYIRGSQMTPGLRVTLAHELTHVLQDQHFDLTRMYDLPDGKAGVMRALAEGDATRIEDIYRDKVLTAPEKAAYEKQSQKESSDATTKLDKEVPAVLTAIFEAPYIFGPELVAYLEAKDKGSGIDEAFQDPPTEEVLWNPQTFQSDDAKGKELTIATPSGTTKTDGGEFGQTAWFLLLASRLDPKVAMKAVDGMGDDGYVTYKKGDGQVCVRLSVTGDRDEDVNELNMALSGWAAKGSPGSAKVTASDGRVTLDSCDPGAKVKGIGKVSPDVLGLPVTRTQIYNSVIKEGLSETQASCYAQTIIDSLSTAELSSDSASPEVKAKIADAQRHCI